MCGWTHCADESILRNKAYRKHLLKAYLHIETNSLLFSICFCKAVNMAEMKFCSTILESFVQEKQQNKRKRNRKYSEIRITRKKGSTDSFCLPSVSDNSTALHPIC